MTIELTEYELSEPKYLPAGAFADVYTGNPRIKKIKFKLPDDAYRPQLRLFHVRGKCFSFPEFNYINGNELETFVEIYPSNRDELFLIYPTNHEHIDGLKRDLEAHKNKVKELTKIIKKLEKIK